MEYRIDREELAAFVARQVDLVEAGAIPPLLAQVTELRLRHESVSRDEVRALWLGAGLATHVGLAIFEEPERFITAGEPSPPTPAALELVARPSPFVNFKNAAGKLVRGLRSRRP